VRLLLWSAFEVLVTVIISWQNGLTVPVFIVIASSFLICTALAALSTHMIAQLLDLF
jgi:putative Ca2+/H+ antiporter (TMEM165/GDT1 family)